jgi:hypothetical protein
LSTFKARKFTKESPIDKEKPVENKLEKIMMSWATRYRFGSNKNKPPQFPEDDPKLAKTIRMCQVLYEMFVELTSSKGEEQQHV